MVNTECFWDRVEDRRNELKITQRELAEKSDISIRTLEGLILRKATPKLEKAFNIANSLDISIFSLIDTDNSQVSPVIIGE
jgi:transcriptional regulator with XRE-family HTH domain